MMRLHVKKIHAELKRIGKNQAWLADHAKVSRQCLSQRLLSGKVQHAEFFAKALGFAGKDLIIE